MRKNRQQQQEQSDDDSQQQNQESYLEAERRKPKIDRLDKIKNFKKITINLSMTQYPVITEVAQNLDWNIQSTNDAGDWDVFWIDMAIDPDILIKMHLFQKISHYPGIHIIARKNLLGINLMSLRTKMPQQFQFFPLTWMLPLQYADFRSYYQSKPKGKARTYIAKPEAQCQGRGIFLTRKIQDLENGKHYVVQRYVARPYLIQGLKFDLRIYILLCGTNPLRLYIYNEGLARLATQKYSQPNRYNLEKQFIHLTNYAINKNNPKFIFNNNSNNMGVGHKRSVSSVFNLLADRGVDIQQLKKKIHDVAIKTVICGLPLMAHQYRYSQPEDYSGNMCFHILGLDIMLNNKAEPILLEVNHTPSFTTDTPLDHHIKYNLIRDTLVLMNINTKTKRDLFDKAKQISKQRLYNGKRLILEGRQRQMAILQAQRLRDEYQDKHLGGFKRIFPTKDQQLMIKYNSIIQIANKTYVQDSGSLRLKQIQKQTKKILKSQLKQIIKNNSMKEVLPQNIKQQSQQKTTVMRNEDFIYNKLNIKQNSLQSQILDNALNNFNYQYQNKINSHKQQIEEEYDEQGEEVLYQQKFQKSKIQMAELNFLRKHGLNNEGQYKNEKRLKLYRENELKCLEIKHRHSQQTKKTDISKKIDLNVNFKTSNNNIEQPHSANLFVSKLYNQSQIKQERIKSNSTAKSQLKRTKELYGELPQISDTIVPNHSNLNKRQHSTPFTPRNQKNPISLTQKLQVSQRPQKQQKAQIRIYDQIARNIQDMIQKKTKGQYVMPKIVNLNVSKQKAASSSQKRHYFMYEFHKDDI